MDSEKKILIPKTRFTEYFTRANGLADNGFSEWVFLPGMLFQAPHKWWGKGGKRDNLHEGLDLCIYRDRRNRISHFKETTRIPAMYDGVVLKIIDDFLGKSVFMEHVLPDNNNILLLTIYGHTRPVAGLEAGSSFYRGDVIACLAGRAKPEAAMAPHLHISTGWSSQLILPDQLDWKTIGTADSPTLFNPLDVMDGLYTVSDDETVISRDL